MKLSYRDKIILSVFVLIMTLFVGFVTIIKPKFESISSNNQLLSEKIDYKANVKRRIALLDELKKNNENENEQIKEIQNFFTPKMNTSEIDKYIYAIAKKNDISIDDMQLISSEEKDLAFYNPLNIENNDDFKIRVNCASGNIRFNVKSQKNIKNFLDDIDELETSIIVDSCSIVYINQSYGYDVMINVLFYSV